MAALDLLGDPVDLNPPLPRGRQKIRGYAADPGSGPEGETCGGCQHSIRQEYHTRTYWKCGHDQGRISRSAATDIRKSSPACKLWEEWDGD